jgi:hypothetical protein
MTAFGEKMNIIVAGIIGRYPYGGVAWCSLMYLLGLRALGHNVWYLEDTGECNYDPVANTRATEPIYATDFIRACLKRRGFADRWCYVDYTGRYHGLSREDWLRVCHEADLFINLSGGCWFWRHEYAAIPHSAFIDSDPAFTQLSLNKCEPWYLEFFKRFGTLFTFGRNIGTAASGVPNGQFRWEHTWQPVCTDEWRPSDQPPLRPCFTTIMSWRIESFADIGGDKNTEFHKVIDLPSRVSVPLELSISCPGTERPDAMLREHGWRCHDAFAVSRDLDVYRDYVRSSLGEFSVAKHTYVRTNSGWFSDRTECYLMAGRPAVVQDTGFSAHLPTGAGLIGFRDVDDARAGIEAVQSDYQRHARAAREIAVAHFSAQAVLPRLLEVATARRTGAGAASAARMQELAPQVLAEKGVA